MPESTTVTVLFTDVVGSTSMRQREGESAAHEILGDHNSLVRQQIEQHAGQEVKTIGDSFMVAFDSARKGIDCAIAVQRSLAERNARNPEQNVNVRIGLHTGEAIRDGNDLFGTSIDAAARIMSRADGEEILISDTLKAVLGAANDLRFGDRGRFRLKGFTERWRLWEVAWRVDDAAERGVGAAERSPFVGRFEERESLRKALERASGGRGTVVLVGGEAGVGKTRLAAELAIEARQRGMFVAQGHCYEMEGTAPYLVFVEAIEYALRVVSSEQLLAAMGDAAPEVARLVPRVRLAFPEIGLSPELPPEQARHFMFESVCDFFERAATAQPLLLVLEDFHWADESTVHLLERVARRVEMAGIVVLCTYRDIDLTQETPFRGAIERLLRLPVVSRLPLHRMERADVAQLIRGLAGRAAPDALVEVIFNETEGVPFFVEEVYRHLEEERRLTDAQGAWLPDVQISEVDVPDTVRVVLGRRIGRVSDATRAVLSSAAAIGRQFTFDFVAALNDASEDAIVDALDEAERAHLIVGTEGREPPSFVFAHEQIRQTLLSELTSVRRQRLHLRVAEAMERLNAADIDIHVTELAFHFSQAGSRERAAGYLVRAGDASASQLATNEALAFYARAINLADSAATRRWAHIRRGALLLALFRGVEAAADYEHAVNSAQAEGATADELQALLGLAQSHYVISLDHGPAVGAYRDAVERALALAVATGDRASEVRALLASRWLADYDLGYRPVLQQNLQRAREIADELGDPAVTLEVQRLAFRFASWADLEVMSRRLIESLERSRDLVALNEHLFYAMWAHLNAGQYQTCINVCDRGVSLATRLGAPPVMYATIKAMALLQMGRFGESWKSLESEVADEAHPFGRAFQRWGQARWLLASGDFAAAIREAEQTIKEADALGRVWMQRAMRRAIDMATLELALGSGDRDAVAAWERTTEEHDWARHPESEIEALLAAGDPANALSRSSDRAARCLAAGDMDEWLPAEEQRIRALLAMNRADEALDAARAALDFAATNECGRLAWQVRSSLAAALDLLGASEADLEYQAAAKELQAVANTIPARAARERYLALPAAAALLKRTNTRGRTA